MIELKSLYFDRKGNPISWEECGIKLSAGKYKFVRSTNLDWGGRVSTVWLGINHGTEEHPLIFETMVFPEDNWSDLEMKRYATEEEAIEGHESLVRKWGNKK